MTQFDQLVYTESEQGERNALLAVRGFITMHGPAEVDAYCAQRLHDIAMDRRHWDEQRRAADAAKRAANG